MIQLRAIEEKMIQWRAIKESDLRHGLSIIQHQILHNIRGRRHYVILIDVGQHTDGDEAADRGDQEHREIAQQTQANPHRAHASHYAQKHEKRPDPNGNVQGNIHVVRRLKRQGFSRFLQVVKTEPQRNREQAQTDQHIAYREENEDHFETSEAAHGGVSIDWLNGCREEKANQSINQSINGLLGMGMSHTHTFRQDLYFLHFFKMKNNW